jgi:hypothetical protein
MLLLTSLDFTVKLHIILQRRFPVATKLVSFSFMYIYGLGPGLLYRVLPDKYWHNFCKLVCGVHLILQHSISRADLISTHQLLLEFVIEFEELYCQ